MPFGKYIGWRISDLPAEYFDWLLTIELRDPLRTAVFEDARRRQHSGPDPATVEDVIAAGQRALARRHHPDAGGDHEAMLKVRAAADWLFAQASQLRGGARNAA